jgi:ribosome biogenesis ATPase
LAKATPGYVGADLAALTGAAGIIAVKRIFKQLSDGTLVRPDPVEPAFANHEDVAMAENTTPALQSYAEATSCKPTAFLSLPSQLGPGSIGHFLIAHPHPLTASKLAPLCITPHDFTLALKQVQPSSKREGLALNLYFELSVTTVVSTPCGDPNATRRSIGAKSRDAR